MPEKPDMMKAIRKGLGAIRFEIHTPSGNWTSWKVWTGQVMTALCEIGQGFGFYVCVNKRHARNAEHGEWLYDMTWLEYQLHTTGRGKTNGPLLDVHLAAECEWSGFHRSIVEVESDFSKLLAANASVRLMVCYDWRDTWKDIDIKDADGLAEHLAEWVRGFKGVSEDDTYLLAVLCHTRFRYFTLGLNGAVACLD